MYVRATRTVDASPGAGSIGWRSVTGPSGRIENGAEKPGSAVERRGVHGVRSPPLRPSTLPPTTDSRVGRQRRRCRRPADRARRGGPGLVGDEPRLHDSAVALGDDGHRDVHVRRGEGRGPVRRESTRQRESEQRRGHQRADDREARRQAGDAAGHASAAERPQDREHLVPGHRRRRREPPVRRRAQDIAGRGTGARRPGCRPRSGRRNASRRRGCDPGGRASVDADDVHPGEVVGEGCGLEHPGEHDAVRAPVGAEVEQHGLPVRSGGDPGRPRCRPKGAPGHGGSIDPAEGGCRRRSPRPGPFYDPAASTPRPTSRPPSVAAAADGKPVLLDFGADWCPDCVVLAPRVRSLRRLPRRGARRPHQH